MAVRFLNFLLERLLMRRLWAAWRDCLAAAAVPGSGGIVVLGDSITHGGRWDLMFPGLPMRNFGISGERSEHLLTRLDPIIGLRPDKLFLLIGTNDLFVGRSVDDICSDVDQIIDRLSRALPDCRIHLQTVMPRAEKYAERIRALNLRYREIASRHGIHLIDLYPVFEDGKGKLRKALTYDGLHLQGAGYRIWGELLEPYIVAQP
ncbi:GDSL-type esterase/lipase family protein [Solimonas sp. K1W22B-7]|uniref:GDSL-type esterase/lipase family protein n=1 Tax=Solimonas sp. K1W22B-7 TaxID=2303331 RepID=UPI0013C473F5|nr:GDSL-type esterase/lipase family protein [Solimonas sp. K1W22B-7]